MENCIRTPFGILKNRCIDKGTEEGSSENMHSHQIHNSFEITHIIYGGNTSDRETIDKMRTHVSLILASDRNLIDSVKIEKMARNNEFIVLMIRLFLTMLKSSVTDTPTNLCVCVSGAVVKYS